MPRIVKEEDFTLKRNEILDAAQKLVYTKGYEQMTIQDILDDLKISKGAFYHYFGSKQALLEALIDRILEEAQQVYLPIAQDPGLTALEKLHRFFDTLARWKTAQKEYLLALLRIWYTDDNMIVRQKVQTSMIKQAAPVLTGIIQQGIREGVLNTPYPDLFGEVSLALVQSLGDAIIMLILSDEPKCNKLQRIENIMAAYSDALERVLGAPRDSLNMMDVEMLEEWLD